MDDNVEVFEDEVRVDDQYQIGEEQDREARGNIVGNVEIEAAPDTIGQQSTWKQLLDRAPVDENHSVPTEAAAGAGVQNDTGQTAHVEICAV